MGAHATPQATAATPAPRPPMLRQRSARCPPATATARRSKQHFKKRETEALTFYLHMKLHLMSSVCMFIWAQVQLLQGKVALIAHTTVCRITQPSPWIPKLCKLKEDLLFPSSHRNMNTNSNSLK